MAITWKIGAMGNASGSYNIDGQSRPLNAQIPVVSLPGGGLPNALEIISDKGKLADSEDSFLYLFCEIDPEKENIDLSARFEVLDMDFISHYQTGFGILAADTSCSGTESSGSRCRHRNHLLLGRFRTADGRNYGYGLRAVGGYRNPDAMEYEPVRKLDPTRIFGIREEEDVIHAGDACSLHLQKTDEGFISSIQKGEEHETISFPGCDFLMQQDPERISIGFAVAGKLRLRISNIQVRKSAGKSSKTPEDTIQCIIPDYPFRRELFDDRNDGMQYRKEGAVLYASPDGKEDNTGTETEPMDLAGAIQAAGKGSEIVLLDGIYKLKEPLYLSSRSGGTFQDRCTMRAQNPRRAVLDGSGLHSRSPLMVLRGKYWIIDGLTFQNSPLSGVLVCGSGNLVRNCEACHNGDTGILICAYPGADKKEWPSYNHIEDCDSYDNCDPVRCNADGFGAKLSVGKGNEFYRCIAHHNIDDGFDLYSKSIIGPIQPVVLEQCIAYKNGMTLNEQNIRENHSGGIGFKLGGENQAAEHELWDCVAFSNQQFGFSTNSNPTVRLHFCTSLQNGRGKKGDDYFFYHNREDMPGAWLMEKLEPSVTYDGRNIALSVIRKNQETKEESLNSIRREDGSIELPWMSSGQYRKRNAGARLVINQKKRILMIIATLGGGGAERVTTILASEFSKKYSVYLLHMYPNVKETYQIAPEVCVIDGSWSKGTFLEKRFHIPVRWPFRAWSILRAKQKYHIDVTVSMLHKPNLYNGLIRWRDRRIMSERNDPSRKPAKEFADARKSFSKADHVVFQSERVQKLFAKDIQTKSGIIRNPIAVSCYADSEPEHRIVTVGRYTLQKNHELLIRAFHEFYQAHPSYTLHLYGEGELQKKMQNLIEELHLEKAVFLEGFKTNIHEHIKNAKMFVLSSDYEGMSNALMEAMMMGLPCISTSCTGSDELLEDGETGLLVPVGDQKALAQAMCRLADDEELCANLRDHAQLQSLEFEKKSVVRAWERIL